MSNPTRHAFSGLMRCILLTALGIAGSAIYAESSGLTIQGSGGWLFPIWESHTQVNQPAIEKNLHTLAQLNRLLADRGTQLFVLIVPMKAALYVDHLPSSRGLSTDVQARYGAIQHKLAAHKLPSVNVLQCLQLLERTGTQAFFKTDYHWTARAAESVADEFATLIDQAVQFDAPPSGGNSLGEWINVRRYGDLATRFLSTEQRSKLSRDVFQVRKEPLRVNGLLDLEPTEVQVIGNSFVQPYFGFAQRLSSRLHRPVSLSWNPGNKGPWHTMRQYLESDDFKLHRPKAIVWQFNEPQMHADSNAKGDWDDDVLIPMDLWFARAQTAIEQK